jgi:hypothetical protein
VRLCVHAGAVPVAARPLLLLHVELLNYSFTAVQNLTPTRCVGGALTHIHRGEGGRRLRWGYVTNL